MNMRAIALLTAGIALALSASGQSAAPASPKSMRLYVLDCGMLTPTKEGVERYHITIAEAALELDTKTAEEFLMWFRER